MKILLLLLPLLFLIQSPNEKAFDFEATTEDGKVVRLSDYQGEVVYLSFWASWCGVCKRNFYAYKDTRAMLKEKGVVLLNVSMDKDEKDWRNAMGKTFIEGDHALINDYDEVMNRFGINSLPRYEIINKKGELVYLSQEENRDIFADFDKWLKE